MNFSREDFAVTLEGNQVTLLRKEFFLLQFLYENKGRVFSREELLDACWPMEEPTDRTVDDHIYRLRKKLFPFRDKVMIKTVKGVGYTLKLENSANESPIPVPEEISRQANELMATYYKYGQGKAVKELITNKTLGFPTDEKQETVIVWLQSDFESLLKKLDGTKHIFVPLLLYGFVESDTKTVISVQERVLQKNILSEKDRMDITCVSLALLYLKINKPAHSMQLIQEELDAISSPEHGFFPFLHIMKTIILFYDNKMDEVEKGFNEAENVLIRFPFLKEQAALKMMRGLFLIEKGKEKMGKHTIDQAIRMVHQSNHTYYFLLIYQVLELLLPKAGTKKELIHHYKKEATDYFKHTNLFKLKTEIKKQVFSVL
ncbi:winged helix-turn-helix domain-containing protein [Virgibacillus kimchii]